MTTLTQGIQIGEWLISEAEGSRSRDVVTVTVAGAVALPSGTVLGKITATGKYVKRNGAAVDGSETAKAILYNALPGTNGDYQATVFNTDAEVTGALLENGSGVDATVTGELLALGIKVR